MIEANLDEGFLLDSIQVYPLDSQIDGACGPHNLSPAAMEILCELASANRNALTAEHLIAQIWGNKPPEPGTLEHYVAELKHVLLDDAGNPMVMQSNGQEAIVYWLTSSPHVLAKEMKWSGLFSELQRRKVPQTAVFYLVSAWLIIQVAALVLPSLGFQQSIVQLIIIASIIGFPIALTISWFYDAKRTEVGSHSKSASYSLAYILAAALVAVPIALLYQWNFSTTDTPSNRLQNSHDSISAAPASNTIAVLAFTNLGGDAKYDYFSDGLAEEILNALNSTGSILVAPRTASFVYKESTTPISEIGIQLGVRYLLEGSVRRQAKRVRVSARLVDISTGFHAWSNTYDHAISDIFAVQEDISKQVVSALNIILSDEDNSTLGVARTKNIEAYDFYLQARDYLQQPSSTTSLVSASSLFERAIKLDPEYADAYAGLCDSFLRQYVLTNTNKWFSKAEEMCNETLRFDVMTVDVRIALGNLYRHSGQTKQALHQLKIAHFKAPRNIIAISALAQANAAVENDMEAEALFQQVISLQPRLWSAYVDLGNFLFDNGRYEEAIPYYEHAVELTPDNAFALNNLGAALLMTSKFDKAADIWRKSLAIEVTFSALSNAGSSMFLAGQFDDAAEAYRQAANRTPDRHQIWGNLADALRHGKEPAQSAQYYARAAQLAEIFLEINAKDNETKAMLAYYYVNLGKQDEAVLLLKEITDQTSNNVYTWYYLAQSWASLNNNQLAEEALEKSIELGYPIEMILSDPGLTSITTHSSLRKKAAL